MEKRRLQPRGMLSTMAIIFLVRLLLGWNDSAILAATKPVVGLPSKKTTFMAGCVMDMTVAGVPAVKNPYNPADIKVDAIFQTPRGKTVRVLAFVWQSSSLREISATSTHGVPDSYVWQIRYMPATVGQYTCQVEITNATDKIMGHKVFFHVLKGNTAHTGMIGVSRGNPWALDYHDGQSFLPVGQNLSWATSYAPTAVRGHVVATFRYWLNKLAANHANCIRLWTNMPGMWIQSWHHPYKINQLAAGRLDRVMAMCQKRGIHVILCIENIRAVNWNRFPFSTGNGGPAANGTQFVTKSAAQRQFKALLRYYIARWGAYRSLMSWELWNEMDCFPASQSAVIRWSGLMSRYIHRHDPYHHLIDNSLGSTTVWPGLWQLPRINLVMYHDYGGRDLYKGRSQVGIYANAIRNLLGFHKPVLLEECGLVANNWGANPHTNAYKWPSAAKDTHGYAFHEALWIPFFCGAAGGGMHWWWDGMIDPYNYYPQYLPLAKFFKGIPLAQAPMPPITTMTSVNNLKCFARGNKWGVAAWVWNHADKWENLVINHHRPAWVKGASVTFPTGGAGRFLVECMNTWTGEVLLRRNINAVRGSLTVRLPNFKIDIAIKAIRIKVAHK